MKDDYLRERGSDIEDVMRSLLKALSGAQTEKHEWRRTRWSLLRIYCHRRSPSWIWNTTARFATDNWRLTSHTAILARGVGIPGWLVCAISIVAPKPDDRIIVERNRNEVVLASFRCHTRTLQSEKPAAPYGHARPIKRNGEYRTKDGVAVTCGPTWRCLPNLTRWQGMVRRELGLYRSEFLLARRGGLVSEDEQRLAYEAVAKVAGAEGAVIRLFDFRRRQPACAVSGAGKNPALGLRAIRFVLTNEDVMREQVRAILRAAASGHLKIVLPMVTDVRDVKRAQAIIHEEAKNLRTAGSRFGEVSIGAMIEVPSAVFMADKIARIVDFFRTRHQ